MEINVEEDDFEELVPERRGQVAGPVVMSVVQIGRMTTPRLQLRVDEELLRAVAGDGWPRFAVAFSAKGMRFRVAGMVQGPFEFTRYARSKALFLRFPPPQGLLLGEPGQGIAADFQVAGGALYVDLPFSLLQKPKELPPPPEDDRPVRRPPPAPPAAPAPVGKQLTRKEMLAAAAERFKAPKF